MKYLSIFIMLVLTILSSCGEGEIDTSELCPNGLYYIEGQCTCLDGKNKYGGTCSNPFDVNNPYTDGDDSVDGDDVDAAVDGDDVDAAVDGDKSENDVVDGDITDGDKAENDAVESGISVSHNLTWISIPSGSFMMGCVPQDDDCNSDEKPRHSVSVSTFKITQTEVTNAQYVGFLNDHGNTCDSNKCVDKGNSDLRLGEYGGVWSVDSGYENHPIVEVTWYGAKAFCEAVGEAVGGRLPSEEEWEYAARAGTETIWSCGDDSSCLDYIAWAGNNSDLHTHVVGTKTANAFGLYDMAGNVWEWLEDCYNPDQGCPSRRYRGGGYQNMPRNLRPSYRSRYTAAHAVYYLGFRCTRD